ncbi:hypothetical protein M0R45_036357 [Rubus argutus]|uniref:Uncharacterized protein n=1 Tax=Rubus argutus TaxID=59490 RepID=A0AAW1VXB1_RUBAR
MPQAKLLLSSVHHDVKIAAAALGSDQIRHTCVAVAALLDNHTGIALHRKAIIAAPSRPHGAALLLLSPLLPALLMQHPVRQTVKHGVKPVADSNSPSRRHFHLSRRHPSSPCLC